MPSHTERRLTVLTKGIKILSKFVVWLYGAPLILDVPVAEIIIASSRIGS